MNRVLDDVLFYLCSVSEFGVPEYEKASLLFERGMKLYFGGESGEARGILLMLSSMDFIRYDLRHISSKAKKQKETMMYNTAMRYCADAVELVRLHDTPYNDVISMVCILAEKEGRECDAVEVYLPPPAFHYLTPDRSRWSFTIS